MKLKPVKSFVCWRIKMINTIEAIEAVINNLEQEFATIKSGKGWYAAARRALKHSLELGMLCKQFRKDSVEAEKANKA